MTPTESASGRREGPLPADVPTDAEHITTPRDHRAEALAAALEGRTGHRDPLSVAEQIERITERNQK